METREKSLESEGGVCSGDSDVTTVKNVNPGPMGIDMAEVLTDAGIYSYAAICALSLHELFDNWWDQAFNHKCMKTILEHLKLPKQVESVMILMIEGKCSQKADAYVDLLLNEERLHGNALPVVQDLIVLAVRGGEYDARMRVLIRHVAAELMVPQQIVDECEEAVVECFTEEFRGMSEEQVEEAKQRHQSKKYKRYMMIGLATIGGGTLLGLSGGLAAPLIGAGVGTILGGASAAAIGSAAGAAVIGSLFGLAGAGLTGFKMKKRVGEIEEFAFGVLPPTSESETQVRQLHITIAISGWLTDLESDNFTRPWQSLFCSREQYYLRYESSYLLELGQALDYILSFAVSMAAQEALKYTVLSGIITAITWPASLVTLASVIDNPWGVCCRRSAEVGKQLAEVLLSHEQGQRPVTLIGYSLGARVIYYCLREMSGRKGCEGIVQDAIMLGTPATDNPKEWKKLSRVVSGKIINGYCKTDWLLKFLYRTFAVFNSVAGLKPIECDDRRIQNFDLTDIVGGHRDYPDKLDAILKAIGIRTKEVDPDTVSALKKSSSEIAYSPPTKVSLSSLRSSKSENALQIENPEDVSSVLGNAAAKCSFCSEATEDYVEDTEDNQGMPVNESSQVESMSHSAPTTAAAQCELPTEQHVGELSKEFPEPASGNKEFPEPTSGNKCEAGKKTEGEHSHAATQ
ncbi:transmembrane and coiled-coil domain-containing protein 4-like isoform X2 [Schistocerca gregaria]|uniref:transmembrane and coiled-coil domain-containing protein 4-like isoform X2 n=2 Tax=Schistocerca gregaria TaxID=7010 RepID=UPI00211ED7FF|nr:transmembrane and coiled-coil domain-containing protein 4-like isoform X2 [Schistocerca gregaria]